MVQRFPAPSIEQIIHSLRYMMSSMMGGFCRKCSRFFLKAGRRLNPKNEQKYCVLTVCCGGTVCVRKTPSQSYTRITITFTLLQNPPIILKDNAQAVADLFDRWCWDVLYHPPYFPD
ncbi:hypothetical protein AVEN_7331-1 [Araneus ventricosus]|uniref:Uncharacterized protein n=1 Tax=Araneus ventricosus TaxID=182803 RepID=A0A4Y2BQX5_ARAVE|nr:hypothetical protein AVEN_7331-1 [Araneus ventricosus]